MLFAAPTYYIKWGMCADLTTGEVNMNLFAKYSLIVSMMMILPLLLGTIVGNPVLNHAFKDDVIKMQKFDYIMQGFGGLVIFISAYYRDGKKHAGNLLCRNVYYGILYRNWILFQDQQFRWTLWIIQFIR